jgi:hypothetical protein
MSIYLELDAKYRFRALTQKYKGAFFELVRAESLVQSESWHWRPKKGFRNAFKDAWVQSAPPVNVVSKFNAIKKSIEVLANQFRTTIDSLRSELGSAAKDRFKNVSSKALREDLNLIHADTGYPLQVPTGYMRFSEERAGRHEVGPYAHGFPECNRFAIIYNDAFRRFLADLVLEIKTELTRRNGHDPVLVKQAEIERESSELREESSELRKENAVLKQNVAQLTDSVDRLIAELEIQRRPKKSPIDQVLEDIRKKNEGIAKIMEEREEQLKGASPEMRREIQRNYDNVLRKLRETE